MMKNIFFIFFVKTMLLNPFALLAQEQNKFEVELHYGNINTINRLNLNSATFPNVTLATTNEGKLTTPQYGIGVRFHLNEKIAFKLGYGNFHNGRTLSVIQTIVDDTNFTPQINNFENVVNKYLYHYFSFSQIFKINFIYDTRIEIENGIMFLKNYNPLETFFYLSKESNFQYVLKLGVSKKIRNKVRFSVRSTFFHGLQNFTVKEVDEGFVPFSIGGEVGVGYIF